MDRKALQVRQPTEFGVLYDGKSDGHYEVRLGADIKDAIRAAIAIADLTLQKRVLFLFNDRVFIIAPDSDATWLYDEYHRRGDENFPVIGPYAPAS